MYAPLGKSRRRCLSQGRAGRRIRVKKLSGGRTVRAQPLRRVPPVRLPPRTRVRLLQRQSRSQPAVVRVTHVVICPRPIFQRDLPASSVRQLYRFMLDPQILSLGARSILAFARDPSLHFLHSLVQAELS